jgi:hypothetical protein
MLHKKICSGHFYDAAFYYRLDFTSIQTVRSERKDFTQQQSTSLGYVVRLIYLHRVGRYYFPTESFGYFDGQLGLPDAR